MPVRRAAADLGVLLVTSRRDDRWILPKGWIEAGETPANSAAREAFEEAGVTGAVAERPVGSYVYRKKMPAGYAVRARVSVYPLLVHDEHADWPECDERKRRWFSIAQARDDVGDRGLARLLGRLCGRRAGALHESVEALEAL